MQIKLDLHIDVVNTIMAALSKMPYEVSVQPIEIIRKQATPQVEAQAVKAEQTQAGLSD